MSGLTEFAALCANYDVRKASGKVRRVKHDIVKLLRQAVKMASVAHKLPPYPQTWGGKRATPPPGLSGRGRLSSYSQSRL